MNTSQNDPPKCLSAFLRRLLCSGSLPTHPSDLITEPNNLSLFDHPQQHSKTQVTKSHSPQAPGIVARLMGLDSLPDLNWAPKQRTLESIIRSKSVNSANYIPAFDLPQSNHRRVQTSVSFRDIPTALQQENDNFVVLCFENVGGRDKSEMALGELKEKERERKFEKRENQENKKGNGEFMQQKNDDLFVVCFEKVGGSNNSEMGLGETEINRGNLRERKFEEREEKGKNRAFLKQKNEDLLVLCFEKVGGSNEKRLIGGKCEMGFEELRETEKNRGRLRERKLDERGNQRKKGGSSAVGVIRRKPSENLKGKIEVKPLNDKETRVESNFGNKKKSRSRNRGKKFDIVCRLETSSPTSVYNQHNNLSYQKTASSGDSRSRATIPNSRKKLSSKNANFGNNSSNSTRSFVADDNVLIRAKKNKDDKPKKTKETHQDYSELVSEIFRLTEKETKESNWVFENIMNFEDVEEICADFGQQILNLLFHEVVDELMDNITE